MKRVLTAIAAAVLLTAVAAPAPARAQAAGNISLVSKAEVEQVVTNEKGEKETVRVPAAKVLPGEIVIFTNLGTNTGDKPAEKVVITNPIPQHMTYLAESAFGAGTVITFSVDGGQTYAPPAKLTVIDADGKARPAEPKDYTHIRWVFQKDLAPNEQEEVGFRARLN